jgi:hypothetical protein
LLGIELLLFLEGLAAVALAFFKEVWARPLVAPRLMLAAAFLEAFEELFVRVFCDTACARKLPRPCSMFFTGTHGDRRTGYGFGSLMNQYSTFPAKINDLCPVSAIRALFCASNRKQG